ncbi:hypothetical protein M8C21_003876 [Ambrosia artemisiifolia]|uniref:HIT domain-containing protein n=1 Tax=Ambrosia artemisiifolia TaxID=4212 RepID=A0AAD5GS32_AMBAR|nr:hypothetical protein M8C21_003876 [Ambrosia artemisiifolia]
MAAAVPACIFCQIARSSTATTLLHTDDKVVAFQDINPSAFRIIRPVFETVKEPLGAIDIRHYLVIPVEHIATVKDLQRRPQDYSLVRHMLSVGQTLLSRDAPDSTHYRFGFHQPPFNSVNHLHLHCLALPFVPRWKRVKYSSLGPLGGFIEAHRLLDKLKP